MAKTKQGRYRIKGYDGDYKTRNLIVSHSEGHSIMRRVAKKADALKGAMTWMDEHPPLFQGWRPGDRGPYLLVVDERTGDRVAQWTGKETGWAESFNFLAPKKKRRNPEENPKKSYRIQPSGDMVEGQSVGKYIAIRKYEPHPRHKRYNVDHIPTGYLMFQYDKQKTARTVAKKLDERFGDALAFSDPAGAQRLAEIDPLLLGWAKNADRYPTMEDYQAAVEDKRAKERELEREKSAWAGKWIHWGPGSLRYGEEAKILRVHEVDPAGTELGPERIKADLEYSKTHGGLGVWVYLADVVKGRAPKNLPWEELRRGREWGARLNHVVFRMAEWGRSPGQAPTGRESYCIWTIGPGLSEANPPCFPSRAEAEQAAKDFAAKHGGRRGNPVTNMLATKERMLAW